MKTAVTNLEISSRIPRLPNSVHRPNIPTRARAGKDKRGIRVYKIKGKRNGKETKR